MRDPSPRAPFDQGLFLKHFNKGKVPVRGEALRGGGGRAGGSVPAPPARPERPQPAGPRVLPPGEAGEGGGGLPQAGRGEPRYPRPLPEPGPHLFQAGAAGGGRASVPEGARPGGREPQDQLLPGLDLRAATPLPGRHLPVPPVQAGANLMVRRVEGQEMGGSRARQPAAPRARRPPPSAPRGRSRTDPGTRSGRPRRLSRDRRGIAAAQDGGAGEHDADGGRQPPARRGRAKAEAPDCPPRATTTRAAESARPLPDRR